MALFADGAWQRRMNNMAKGSVAKEKVAAKLKEAFGADYVGENQKKYYVWADDGGEKVQIAISLTWAKNPVETVTPTLNGGFDFSGDNEVVTSAKSEPAEITQEEQDNIAELLQRLGL
jgi:hypothetical protein